MEEIIKIIKLKERQTVSVVPCKDETLGGNALCVEIREPLDGGRILWTDTQNEMHAFFEEHEGKWFSADELRKHFSHRDDDEFWDTLSNVYCHDEFLRLDTVYSPTEKRLRNVYSLK